MKIRIHSLIQGSKEMKGIAVIIDVLRACTTIPILLYQGATKIVPVKTPEEVEEYEKEGYIPVGEGKHGRNHKVFHYNNSPSEVYNVDFTGKNIVIRSNNATQAILHATKAADIILASFVNLDRIVEYIKNHLIKDISLVPLGRLGQKGLEDELCAKAIRLRLKGDQYNFKDMKKRIYNCKCANLVRNVLKKPNDVDMALKLNSYPIIPKVFSKRGIVFIKKADKLSTEN